MAFKSNDVDEDEPDAASVTGAVVPVHPVLLLFHEPRAPMPDAATEVAPIELHKKSE